MVSDDEGPEGRTWATLSEYARSEPRVRIVENRRGRGQVENTNNAMLACVGNWVTLLHDDDLLAEGAQKICRGRERASRRREAVNVVAAQSHCPLEQSSKWGVEHRDGSFRAVVNAHTK